MKLGYGIQMVKLVTTSIYLLRPFLFYLFVKHHYNINKKIDYDEEPIKQKRNGFAQHLCAVITNNTDVIILTIFSTLGNVSIYTVYHSVILGITDLVISLSTGLESFWGNMIANQEEDKLKSSFSFTEWAIHTGVAFLFIPTSILIIPFINIYTSGITDINYIQPLFATLLVLAFAMRCIRLPYFSIIKAAGHYKQTQIGAFITMLLNLSISITFVYFFGLVGVALGTLVAFTFHAFYFVIYLSHNILKRSIYHFIIHLFVDGIEIIICVLICYFFSRKVSNYIEWSFYAIIVTLIGGIVIFLINYIIYRNEMKIMFQRIVRKHSYKNSSMDHV
jgi:hypothetical protein